MSILSSPPSENVKDREFATITSLTVCVRTSFAKEVMQAQSPHAILETTRWQKTDTEAAL